MPEETPNAEQPTEQPAPDTGAGGSDPAAVPAPAPTGEGEPGGAATGGAGGESQPQPEAAEEGGSEVPESAGEEEEKPAEAAAPEAAPVTETVLGNGPTQPSSDEQPSVGLPTGEESTEAAEEDDKEVVDELVELGNEALDKAKEIGRKTLKDALVESRDYIKTLLNNQSMTKAEKHEVARLYRAAEKHALMGKVAVSHAMGKRLDNFVKSSSKVHKSQKARASQNYLTGLLRLATGAVSTFFGAFGQPLVEKLTDIGLKATDEFLQ